MGVGGFMCFHIMYIQVVSKRVSTSWSIARPVSERGTYRVPIGYGQMTKVRRRSEGQTKGCQGSEFLISVEICWNTRKHAKNILIPRKTHMLNIAEHCWILLNHISDFSYQWTIVNLHSWNMLKCSATAEARHGLVETPSTSLAFQEVTSQITGNPGSQLRLTPSLAWSLSLPPI